MRLRIHPLARRSLEGLALAHPLACYRPGITERLFTNPYAGAYRTYPSLQTEALQARFAAVIYALGKQPRRRRPALKGNNVLFTPGSVAGIDLLIRAYCEPGTDSIAVARPTFPAYERYARAAGVGVQELPLEGPDRDRLNLTVLEARTAKITFLCNPTSPIGSILSRDQIKELCRRTAGIIVVDEAYIEFAAVDSVATLIEPGINLLALRTFSKAWGLAGLRVGAVLGRPELLHPLRLLQDPFAFDTAAQRAVSRQLANVEGLRRSVARICAERERLADELAGLPCVRRVYPSHANFLCVTLRDGVCRLGTKAAASLLVSDVSHQVEDSLRIAIGNRADNDKVIAALRGLTSPAIHPVGPPQNDGPQKARRGHKFAYP